MQEYFTVTEVAEMKNVNPETVRRWLRNGKIKGERLGGTKSGWRIHRSELYPEETHMEQRIVELIKNMLEDRAMFNQFARDVLYLLKKTTRQLMPEETSEMFLARTNAKDADLTAELWQSRVLEQKEMLEEVCGTLERNYETFKKQWQTNAK
ncbi:helix-turn-helix domain-containing protein [Dethiobacter alkaliphilus]|uniref:DNA binding domain protein, excisionase family n=1 Tax=Dethiobacter alkaliphilus AHT 1 TaxID=555088 RepID=C0GIN9_DETAL|nr:helix-turn-helix domain-containing protein [Dethiobacter alkaliphilus]EEG76703.1 DNA binding domain protein, excisionase family [Dethiobacter alkaliphilus AHT 1]MCW3490911.1 helix-turn-helix domain-containing protein [Dethiobacter alkaliphilus]